MRLQTQWASIISRCSLSKTDLLAAVAKRHELGNWDFPALSDQEQRHREALQQVCYGAIVYCWQRTMLDAYPPVLQW